MHIYFRKLIASDLAVIGMILFAGVLLIGCAEEPAEVIPLSQPNRPIPTVNALLIDGSGSRSADESQAAMAAPKDGEQTSAQPTVAAVFGSNTQVTLVPTPTKRPLAESESELNLVTLSQGVESERTNALTELTIYDDELDENWTIENSADVVHELTSTARWFEVLDENEGLSSKAMSIALKPSADFGQLFFTVRQDSAVTYDRDEVLGVSFWLHTGAEIVDTGDFAVTVVGSNENPYWSPDDESVFVQSDDSFSETRLYFLDINRAIPAGSWVKIEIWLDDLLYDPDYEYITGIYIKNDAGVRNQVFIDQLTLLRLRDS